MAKYFLVILIVSIFQYTLLGQNELPEGNQFAWYETGKPERLRNADSRKNPKTIFFRFFTEQPARNLKAKGFIWMDNHPKDHFVAHLVNNMEEDISIERQDGSLMMIQEALNKEGEWQPIEFWVPSGCGNSYFYPLTLKSQHYIMFPVKKYKGNYSTKIRLKWRNGEKVIYSRPFEGSIDEVQFQKETGTVHGILYHGKARYLDN